MTKNTNAVWNISLICECPHCKKTVDLIEADEFFAYRRLDSCLDAENQEVFCPECGEEFIADFVY